jgi:NADPH-dependent glutamate synthase beta subunit-like oxidoreductase
MGVEFKCGVEVGKDVTLDELRAEGIRASIWRSVCRAGRCTGVSGEDAEGVESGVSFLLRATEAKQSGWTAMS